MPELVVIAILLICIILLSIQCIHYSRRIHQIRLAIKAMAQGDLASPVVLSSFDKLGDISRSIHELSGGIEKRLLEKTNEKEKLEAILSNMAEGVLVISNQERFIHVSPSFLNMFKVRSNDWQNKFYWEIIANPSINESIRESILHKKGVRQAIVIVHPQEMFFEMVISPVLNASGQLISVVAVFHDVTELKKFERLRTEFVANVSHELKTPLTSIKGFVETLLNGALNDPAHAARFLEIIKKQTQRLEYLVSDLLVLSSLESKDVKMNLIQANVTTVLSSVVLMKKTQMEEKKQELLLNLSPQLPLIMIDTQRMEQVFLNLLDNAVKFTPQEGKIEIKAAVDDSYLRVDVIDNGCGISSEHITRIFERFYRTDKARNTDSGGTGLGLSIAKHIVEAHQGMIRVESVLGSGCTFSVFLPLAVL